MRRIVTFALAMFAAGAAYAGGAVLPSVPEIDAVAGLAALGLVGAVATLIWERRRERRPH